jgi:hypothetical protein
MAGHYYSQPPRRRLWPWLLGGFVLIVVVVFLSIGVCVVFVNRVAKNAQDGSRYTIPVTYQVEGSGRSVAIKYSPGIGHHTSTATATALPWTKDAITGGTVSLTATNDQSGGTITCRIFANGKQIAEQTATGPLASASCSGDAGLNPVR